MTPQNHFELVLEKGKGIFRLAPTWVPRAFCVPGKRLRLHPDDYYALGTQRGGSMSAGSPPPPKQKMDRTHHMTKGSASLSLKMEENSRSSCCGTR